MRNTANQYNKLNKVVLWSIFEWYLSSTEYQKLSEHNKVVHLSISLGDLIQVMFTK